MTSARFLADLRANLIRGDAALERRLMLDHWVYQPGLPDNAARPDPAAFAAVDAAVARLQRRRRGRARCPMRGWNWAERVRFLKALPRAAAARRGSPSSTAPSASRRAAMPRCCSPGCGSRSPTATSRRCRRPSASSPTMGRRKFVLPLFETLIGAGRLGPADRRARSMPAPAPAITASPPTVGRSGACAADVAEKHRFCEHFGAGSRAEIGPNLTFHQSLAARAKAHHRSRTEFDVSRARSH